MSILRMLYTNNMPQITYKMYRLWNSNRKEAVPISHLGENIPTFQCQ